MNVLLLRPDPGNERFGLGPFFRVEPLGIEYVAAALRERGHEPTIVDLRFGHSVGSWVRRTRPRVVGISCMHALEYDRVIETAREVRRAAPDAFILAGGHAAAAFPQPLESAEIDAICTDDGEEIVPAVAEALRTGRPLTEVPGLRVKTRDGWTVTAPLEDRTGLDAVPILALLSFMVGAVVAFLGSTALASYGASIFTVDLIGFAFLREFGVLLTAILLAGRTASAFTAQIGSMKAREEIDAIRTLGLDPIELLVLPRVLALLVSLPLLTFIAMIAGIVGGGVVCLAVLKMSPSMFLSMLQQDMSLTQFLVGMGKAPVFAFMIGVIGCMEGFKVSGSAQSVGEHTTSAVVQSIFVVILLDALAALFYMEMGW